jgi:hypothetical protein
MRRRRSLAIRLLVLLPALFGGAPSAAAEPPAHGGMVVLFGNLHSHSNLSDDTSNVPDAELAQMTCRFGFENARTHGLDFLAVTDHHKAADSNHRLFMTPDEYRTQLLEVARAYNVAHAGQFVAIPGIEWGNTATGNHLNLLGCRELPPDTILDVQYDALFRWAKDHVDFVQFNHPGSWQGEPGRNQTCKNFGEGLYATTADFVREVGGPTATCALLNSVVGGHLSGADRHSTQKVHRAVNATFLGHWKRFLNMGFHLAPSADQDTHWLNCGTVTAARTAAWAKSRTYDDLIEAFRARRVYMTEDDEMVVAFQVEYGGKTYWMGETVPLADDTEDVVLVVKVWQAPGVDGDPVLEGPYDVDIYRDPDGIDNQQASKIAPTRQVSDGVETRFPLLALRGQYVYLEVRETAGKDNPLGEGDDDRDNATGVHQPDGKRDDMNDTAITVPIWFGAPAVVGPVGPPPLFSWTSSSSSHSYHDSTCWAVRQIGATNLRTGNTPPAGRTKHACHPPQ